MQKEHFIDQMVDKIQLSNDLTEQNKSDLIRKLSGIKNQRINLLITGATGCGKSSTINALFNTDTAKVGQGVDPETMNVQKYELDNLVIFDSPGLGDGKEADLRHAKLLTDKLLERQGDGEYLIDLVLVVLDGSSRDLGTSFALINQVILPTLNNDTSRLLVAINQADMAMKGKHWNDVSNSPEPTLVKFLDDKVESTRRRILEASGVNVTPIYYSAGYKEGNSKQLPYNLSKLMLHILRHTKPEKRAVFAQDMNKNQEVWVHDDRLEDYRGGILKNIIAPLAGIARHLGGAAVGAVTRIVAGSVARAFSTAGSAAGFVVKKLKSLLF